jgi:flagellin
MPLSINTNIASMTAQRSFISSNAALETSFERLSTGKRINSAVDDAAGLAIGKDLEARVSGLNQAVRNVNDGISMVQIAEGALGEVHDILTRMRDLAVQGYNGSLSTDELGYLETEHTALATALDGALNQAKFDGVDLISGSTTTVTIQSGANAQETSTITIGAFTASGLGVADADIDFAALTANQADITNIQDAIDDVASGRAALGATQAELESTVRNLTNVAENTAAAAGRIMDTDYASETANLTKAQILQQAATSILAQANAQPQAVLALLQ